MRLLKNNISGIAKARQTLREMENYKSRVKSFLDRLSGSTNATHAARLPQLLLTHFTSRDKAVSIIKDGQINMGEHGYVSLTALHPLEFKTIAQSDRRFGFAFFARDLVNANFDLYTPIAYCRPDGVVNELQSGSPALSERLLCEPTESQSSLWFLNMMEVRATTAIPLDRCALFFREQDLEETESSSLSERGIFQLPYSINWFADHFITSQKWYFRNSDTELEFFDNKSRPQSGECELDTDELITELQSFVGNNSSIGT